MADPFSAMIGAAGDIFSDLGQIQNAQKNVALDNQMILANEYANPLQQNTLRLQQAQAFGQQQLAYARGGSNLQAGSSAIGLGLSNSQMEATVYGQKLSQDITMTRLRLQRQADIQAQSAGIFGAIGKGIGAALGFLPMLL